MCCRNAWYVCVVYCESLKRELNTNTVYGYRCDAIKNKELLSSFVFISSFLFSALSFLYPFLFCFISSFLFSALSFCCRLPECSCTCENRQENRELGMHTTPPSRPRGQSSKMGQVLRLHDQHACETSKKTWFLHWCGWHSINRRPICRVSSGGPACATSC